MRLFVIGYEYFINSGISVFWHYNSGLRWPFLNLMEYMKLLSYLMRNCYYNILYLQTKPSLPQVDDNALTGAAGLKAGGK